MTPIEQAIATARDVTKVLQAANDKSAAAEREHNSLKQELAALESSVSSAETAHANAAVAQQFGEDADLTATAAALEAARKALENAAPELRHKIRVAAAVAERLSSITLDHLAKHVAAQAMLKTAVDVHLAEKLAAERQKSSALFEQMTDSGEVAYALERILLDREAPYQGGWPERINRMIPPHDAGVARAREAILAEIAAAMAP